MKRKGQCALYEMLAVFLEANRFRNSRLRVWKSHVGHANSAIGCRATSTRLKIAAGEGSTVRGYLLVVTSEETAPNDGPSL
jgi:hypothetical protein